MDIQLKKKKTNQYCFVYDKSSKSKGFAFELQFVEWDFKNDENVPVETKVLSLAEFTQWWETAKVEGWKIENV